MSHWDREEEQDENKNRFVEFWRMFRQRCCCFVSRPPKPAALNKSSARLKSSAALTLEFFTNLLPAGKSSVHRKQADSHVELALGDPSQV